MTKHDPRIPKETVIAVLRRAGGQCEDCTATLPLELHHLYYNVDGEPDEFKYAIDIRGREKPDDLKALCRECHLARHVVNGVNGKEFFRDPQDAEAERVYQGHIWKG